MQTPRITSPSPAFQRLSQTAAKQQKESPTRTEEFTDQVTSKKRFQERLERQIKELQNEQRLNQFIFNSNLPLLLRPVIASSLPGEPTMMIQILKSKVPLHLIQSYYKITPRGMIGSLRTKTNGDIYIGRSNTILGEVTNDIVLDENTHKDNLISRYHAKINYLNGLNKKGSIPSNFMMFLMCSHTRAGMYSKFSQLPKHLFMMIYKYLNLKEITICDLGSLYGTYKRIKEKEKFRVQEKMYFLIGPKIGIVIQKIYNSLSTFLQNDLTTTCNMDLLKSNIKLVDAYAMLNEIKENYPTIRFKIVYGEPCSYIIDGEEMILGIIDDKYKFEFGPHFNDNRKINSSIAFSFEYSYNQKIWTIEDESLEKLKNTQFESGTNFGLWNSISEAKISGARFISQEKELKSSDEIKISETIFRVSWK